MRGDLLRPFGRHVDVQDGGRSLHDPHQVDHGVEVEMVHDPEAVAQRAGEQADPRGGTDQREGWQVDLDRAGHRPLADDDVDAEVLHGLVENLLERRLQPVDLVDEQDAGALQVGENGREITGPLDGRTRGALQHRPHLVRQDVGDGGLAEAGRAVQQHVIERLAARPCRPDEDGEVGLDLLLPDVVVERARSEGEVDAAVASLRDGIEKPFGGGGPIERWRGRIPAGPSPGLRRGALLVVRHRRVPRDVAVRSHRRGRDPGA